MADYLTDLAARLAPALVGEAIEDHATTHADGGDDEVAAEDLATALTAGQVLVGAGGGALEAGDAEDIATAIDDGKILVADSGALVAGFIENIATDLDEGMGVASDGAGALVAAPAILTYVSEEIDHEDFQAGASDDITLSPAFPDAVCVGPARLIVDETPAGEADFAGQVGDAGDPDGKIASVTLHDHAAGYVTSVGGVESGFRFEADYTPRFRGTATELSDLTAGKVRVAIDYYYPPAAELTP